MHVDRIKMSVKINFTEHLMNKYRIWINPKTFKKKMKKTFYLAWKKNLYKESIKIWYVGEVARPSF